MNEKLYTIYFLSGKTMSVTANLILEDKPLIILSDAAGFHVAVFSAEHVMAVVAQDKLKE